MSILACGSNANHSTSCLFETLQSTFFKVAPVLWNNIPPSLRASASVTEFKKNLKTHLCHKTYDCSCSRILIFKITNDLLVLQTNCFICLIYELILFFLCFIYELILIFLCLIYELILTFWQCLRVLQIWRYRNLTLLLLFIIMPTIWIKCF